MSGLLPGKYWMPSSFTAAASPIGTDVDAITDYLIDT